MSTILDALSRAERERQMGAAPRIADTLRTAPEACPGPTRRLKLSGRAALAGGALLAVTGAGWIWLQQPSQPSQPSQPLQSFEPSAGLAEPAVGAPVRMAPRATSSPSLPGQASQTSALAAPSQPLHLPAASYVPQDGAAARPSATTRPREKPGVKREHSPAIPDNSSRAHAPAAQASAVASAPTSAASSTQGARAHPGFPKGRDDASKTRADKAGAPSATPVLPTVAELTEATRQQLPSLAVNGYIYAASAKDRSIILNGRLLHEGEDVAPGLKLEQMRPDGVVLEFKGQRFRMAY